MTDLKDDSEELPHADLAVEYGDGSGLPASSRVLMWFATYNHMLTCADAEIVHCARVAAMVHGFIPSIYRGPRP